MSMYEKLLYDGLVFGEKLSGIEYGEKTGVYEIEVGNYIGTASLYHITKTGEYKRGIGYFH